MKSDVILFLVALVLLLVVIRYDVNYLDYKSPISYFHWKEITWKDFKGLNKPYRTLYGEKKFAFISTDIQVDRTDDGDIMVNTFFHPSRSYVFSQNTYSNALLTHELYHFHIAEMVARRIRRDFQNGIISPSKPDGFLYKYVNTEDSLQEAYDTQTFHGYVSKEQQNWQKRIDSCLLVLKDYSNPIIEVQ